jgi:hypothetical protein
VIRTAANGDTLWTRIYGGALEDDCNALLPTADDGFILCGITLSSGAGGVDVLVIKGGANGAVSWSRTYGGAGDDYGFFIEPATGGGYLIAGTTNSSGAGGYDMLLMKIDAGGTLLWAKTYGSTDTDLGACVRTTSTGGQVLLGQSFGFGVASDLYLVRTDAAGDTLWTRSYGGSGYEFESTALVTADDGYLLCGGEESFGPDRDAYLVKTDDQGNSGCNEASTATVVGTPTLSEAVPTLAVSTMAMTVTVPATVSASGGASNVLCSTAAIPTHATPPALSVLPLPFSTTFQVSGTEADGLLVITDLTGKVRMQARTQEGNTTIDARELAAGLYALEYRRADRRAVMRLVKE